MPDSTSAQSPTPKIPTATQSQESTQGKPAVPAKAPAPQLKPDAGQAAS